MVLTFLNSTVETLKQCVKSADSGLVGYGVAINRRFPFQILLGTLPGLGTQSHYEV